MKTLLKITSIILLLSLVILPVQSVSAASGVMDGKVIIGQAFTLASGETLDGDLLVFGGSATIEAGAVVNGNAVVFGGSLTVNGEVKGDAAVVGGSANLGAASHVYGNLSTVGSTLDKAEGAQVDGQTYNTATSWTTNGNQHPVTPTVPVVPKIDFNPFQPLASIGRAFADAVGIALLAMLLMLFLAPHADRVAHAIFAQPLVTGGLGLLTTLVAPVAIIILCLTLILIPAAIILIFALVVAGAFGWIAMGYEIGQRFTRAIHQEWHPAFSAGLGVFALTLASQALTGIPVLNCVGWLIPFLLSMAGLGGVILSRFGTQVVNAPTAAMTPVEPAAPVKPPTTKNKS
jgi:hypothetical protein